MIRSLIGRLPALVTGAMLALMPLADHALAQSSGDREIVDGNSANRNLTLGLRKSLVVEVPRAVGEVLVADPSIADAVVRTPYRIYLFGKQLGETNIFIFDKNGAQIAGFDVSISVDTAKLQRQLNRMIPKAKIKIEPLGRSIVLTGSVSSAADAKKAEEVARKYIDLGDGSGAAAPEESVLNYLSITGKDQVLLKVTVVEVQRNLLKQLGVDLTAQFSASNVFGLGAISNPLSLGQGFAAPGLNFNGNTNVTGLAGGFNDGSTFFAARLRALERDGLVRTLAEPTLTAVSGEQAEFLAGGEFPIPVQQDENGITAEFKPFGVSLAFTPIVRSENRITLRVKTEVSELSSNNSVVLSEIALPSLEVRRTGTTVELPSGGSIVLAGLLRDQIRQDVNGFPGLKRVPILGSLFRSRDFLRNQTELAIFVTPYIVSPKAPSKLKKPTDNLFIASDAETIFLGRLNRLYDVSGGAAGGDYEGDVGFIFK
ncbi:type II and III secretion system protein family protein [Coralliovum pocilloporae]|uniref:type II and III secretion system protein family protein n=1 Tax=Coralliovum pocilloporae TaxID=3066369 RepID=UPI003306AE74